MDGWMDRTKIDKQIDGWLNGYTFKKKQVVGWMDRKPQRDGWMNRQMDGRMDIKKQMYGWMDMKKIEGWLD